MNSKLNKVSIERFSRQIVLKDVGIIGQKKIISSKVLVVGDSLWHDIAGGNLLNFDSLWVKSGVHTPQLDKGKEISDLLDNYKPKYAISELKI